MYAAAMLYKATGEAEYLTDAESKYNSFGFDHQTAWAFDWSDKLMGAKVSVEYPKPMPIHVYTFKLMNCFVFNVFSCNHNYMHFLPIGIVIHVQYFTK